MALHIPKAPGFMSLLKEGNRHYDGLDEAVFRNIEACLAICKTTRSCFGPSGQNKIVINHIGKQFVTNDAATILKEFEVEHPAAKILVMASQQQEQESGDGTNSVFQLAGAMLESARELLRKGLSVSQITDGYETAHKKALEILNELVVKQVNDLTKFEEVFPVIRTAIMSKQIEFSDFLSKLITNACISVLPKTSYFNVDNIRVLKVLGSSVMQSKVLKGMVFPRETEGVIKKVTNGKVAIFSCPVDALQTETKGTVLITTANELTSLSKGEEDMMDKQMQSLAAAGVKVVVSGGKVGDLALHCANKYGLMVVRLNSKFDVRRLCQATGATALPKLTTPTAEEIGFVKDVYMDEIGEKNVVIFEQDEHEGSIVTIIVRGSTDNIMDDIERAIDDGVNTYKSLTRDNKVVAGAGATELVLVRRLLSFADTFPGEEQYSIRGYAKSFEVIVKALAENGGQKSTEVIAMLNVKHENVKPSTGLVTRSSSDVVICDAVESKIFDLFKLKYWAIRFATSAAVTILRIDQIIMSRPAGGPKPRQPGPVDADD